MAAFNKREYNDLHLILATAHDAIDELTDGHAPNQVYVPGKGAGPSLGGKPHGVPIELVRLVNSVMAFCVKYDIDYEAAERKYVAYKAAPYWQEMTKNV